MSNLKYFFKDKYIGLITCFLTLITGGLLIRLQKMSLIPFHDWDESIYARLAKEGLSQYIFPQYLSTPWLEKPPLPIIIWQLMLNLGSSEFLLRIISVLLSIGIIFTVVKIINKTNSSVSSTQSLFSTLIGLSVLISSDFLLDRSSLVNVDLFLIFSYLGYFSFRHNRILCAFFIFFGVMSKSLLGFFPLIVELLYLIFSKNNKRLRSFIYQLPLILFPSFAWFLLAYIRYGQLFINEHFRDHLFLRLIQPIELHFGGKFFYILELQKDLGTMSFVLILIIIFAGSIFLHNIKYLKTEFKINDEILLIFISLLLYFIFLTFSKSKLSWYFGPLIPFLAVISAYAFNVIYKKYKIFSFLILVIFLSIGLYRFSLNTFFWRPKLDNFASTTLLGRCISDFHQNKLTSLPIRLLVSSSQRETAHVLEAAKLNISTSFRYAGMPGLIYYAYPQLFEIFYKQDYLVKSLKKNDYLVIQNPDLPIIPNTFVQISICKIDDWNYLQIK